MHASIHAQLNLYICAHIYLKEVHFCNGTSVIVNTVPMQKVSPQTLFTSEYCPPRQGQDMYTLVDMSDIIVAHRVIS